MTFYRAPVAPDLPVMPTPRARGMVLLWNPQAELRDFLAVIEGDPGLTAGVLRAANSAHSAPAEEVSTARNAIVRIGLEAARGITVAALTRAEYDRLDESGLDPDHYWRWLLAIGLLAEAFATHDGLSPDELQTAFTAGLLHQMGRLSYASRSPERYQQVMQLVRAGHQPLDAERQVFGVDSMELSAQLARDWALPTTLLDAIVTIEGAAPSALAARVGEATEVARTGLRGRVRVESAGRSAPARSGARTHGDHRGPRWDRRNSRARQLVPARHGPTSGQAIAGANAGIPPMIRVPADDLLQMRRSACR